MFWGLIEINLIYYSDFTSSISGTLTIGNQSQSYASAEKTTATIEEHGDHFVVRRPILQKVETNILEFKDDERFSLVYGDLTDDVSVNKLVKEIQTPRVDIISLDSNNSLDEAMDLIMNKKFSKIPVYKDTIDNIKGILYAKDIIPYLIGSRPEVDLLKLTREPYFIPETKPIDEVMQEFKLKKTSIAVVVDEWGGTAGILTLEDIVEEVTGELRDPFDKEEYEIIKNEDGSSIVDGSINIYDIEENFEIEFPDDRDYDTLAGFILDDIGDIPKEGEKVILNNYQFKVLKVISNRIDKIEVQSLNND